MTEAKENHHITALRSQNGLNRLAAKKKPRLTGAGLEFYEAEVPAQEADAVVAAHLQAQEEALAKRMAGLEIGDKVEGYGIYIGTWTLPASRGGGLASVFNVFAAPEDLTDEAGDKAAFTYVDLLARMAGLKNWHGHDGAGYARDGDFYEALADDSYKGDWVVPPLEILLNGDSHTLYASKDMGALRGSFGAKAESRPGFCPHWYWSSTKDLALGRNFRHAVSFTDGSKDALYTGDLRISCRPVRLERAPERKLHPMSTNTVVGG